MLANVSPGTMAIVQIITSRYRKLASNNFRFGFMAASIVDSPLKLGLPALIHAANYCARPQE